MSWKNLDDSTDLAEALGLLASLVAAVMALRDAQKEHTAHQKDDSEADQSSDSAKLPSHSLNSDHVGVPAGTGITKGLLKYSHLVKVVAALALVVLFQLVIILFIAYKLL